MSERRPGQQGRPGSDRSEIEERLRDLGLLDDPEFIVDALHTFAADGEETLDRLRAAILDARDASACEQAAHRLKGASMNLGAERLGGLARRLEEIGRGGDLGDAPAVLRDLEEEFAGVRAEALRLADRAEAA